MNETSVSILDTNIKWKLPFLDLLYDAKALKKYATNYLENKCWKATNINSNDVVAASDISSVKLMKKKLNVILNFKVWKTFWIWV